MQIHLFEKFDLNSKACITWKHGIHIGYRADQRYYMCLYRLADFYVEIQYHCCFDGIASIQTFSHEDDLGLYLDQVDLKKLFE